MDADINRLISILSNEREVYQDIRNLSTKKTDLIIHHKIEELDKLVRAEQSLIMLAGNWAQKREKCLEELAETQGVQVDEITMTWLLGKVDHSQKVQLQSIRDKLDETLTGQKRLNQLNEKLIVTNLEYIELALSHIIIKEPSSQFYEQDGIMNTKGKARLLDQKA